MKKLLFLISILLSIAIIGCVTTSSNTKNSGKSKTQEKNVSQDTTVLAASLDTTSPGSITIKWRTESELDNYGFNLYRSLSKKGPWEKVNETIVPGHGTTSVPSDYRYVDTGVKKNTVYYYQLEEVDYAGNSKRLPYTISGKDTKPVEKEKEETGK